MDASAAPHASKGPLEPDRARRRSARPPSCCLQRSALRAAPPDATASRSRSARAWSSGPPRARPGRSARRTCWRGCEPGRGPRRSLGRGRPDRTLDAGIDFADSRCEARLHTGFPLERDRKTVTARIDLPSTATAVPAATSRSGRHGMPPRTPGSVTALKSLERLHRRPVRRRPPVRSRRALAAMRRCGAAQAPPDPAGGSASGSAQCGATPRAASAGPSLARRKLLVV